MADMYAKGRQPDRRGEKSNVSKLSDDQVREIYASRAGQKLLAERYGVCQTNISAIQRGLTWAHVTQT
jgi:hypothetical protein